MERHYLDCAQRRNAVEDTHHHHHQHEETPMFASESGLTSTTTTTMAAEEEVAIIRSGGSVSQRKKNPDVAVQIWKQFVKTNRKTSEKSNFWWTQCKYCLKEGAESGMPVQEIQGRLAWMEKHIEACPNRTKHFEALQLEIKENELMEAAAAASSSSSSTKKRKRAQSKSTSSISAAPGVASSTASSSAKKKQKQSPSVLVKAEKKTKMSLQKRLKIEELLLDTTSSLGLDFAWIHDPSWLQVIEALRPELLRHYLPTVEQFSTIVLEREANEVRKSTLSRMEIEDGYISLICKRREGGSSGPVLTTGIRSPSIYEMNFDQTVSLRAIFPSDNVGISVIQSIENNIQNITKAYPLLRLTSICIDPLDQDGCHQLKWILAHRHPQLVFTPCFSLQVNQIAKYILCDHPKYKSLIEKCVSIGSSIMNEKNHNYSPEKFEQIGNLCTSLRSNAWTSIQPFLSNLLKCQEFLSPQTTTAKLNPQSWQSIAELEQLLDPLVKATKVDEDSGTTLADTVLLFGRMYQALEFHENDSNTVAFLEQMWDKLEQPLFVLTWLVHPEYCSSFIQVLTTDDSFSTVQIGFYAMYYYHKMVGSDSTGLMEDIGQWVSDGGMALCSAFSNKNPIKFWKQMKKNLPKLTELAMALLSISPFATAPQEIFAPRHHPFQSTTTTTQQILLMEEIQQRVTLKNRFCSSSRSATMAPRDELVCPQLIYQSWVNKFSHCLIEETTKEAMTTTFSSDAPMAITSLAKTVNQISYSNGQDIRSAESLENVHEMTAARLDEVAGTKFSLTALFPKELELDSKSMTTGTV